MCELYCILKLVCWIYPPNFPGLLLHLVNLSPLLLRPANVYLAGSDHGRRKTMVEFPQECGNFNGENDFQNFSDKSS